METSISMGIKTTNSRYEIAILLMKLINLGLLYHILTLRSHATNDKVWRGRYSGYRDIYDRGILPREQLVIRASRFPEMMDVHPVSWTYYPDATSGQLLQKSEHQIPFRDFMKYKAGKFYFDIHCQCILSMSKLVLT